MKKANSKSSKKQQGALGDHVSVRANEPFLPAQPSRDQQEFRVSVPTASIIGFNGQLFDSVSGTYLLGNGYRAYSPTMRAFYSPDNLSPFGAGGVSRYQYCNLNPVNYTDPSGHSVVGTAIGIIALLSTVTAVVSVGLEIGRQAHSESDPEYSAYLRELAEGFGTASVVLGVAAGFAGIARARYVAARAVARRGAWKTWGGNVTNLVPVDDGMYLFDDIYQSKLRLNVLAHGSHGPQGPLMYNAQRALSPEELAVFLTRNNANISQYENIRLLSCWSGFGGGNSFASRFSVITGKTVKGYKNKLVSRLIPEDLGGFIKQYNFGNVAVGVAQGKFPINKSSTLAPYEPVKYLFGQIVP